MDFNAFQGSFLKVWAVSVWYVSYSWKINIRVSLCLLTPVNVGGRLFISLPLRLAVRLLCLAPPCTILM